MTIKTDSYAVGSNSDDTRNFLLDTDQNGGLRIRRRSDGSGGLVMSINSAGVMFDKDGVDMRPLGVGQTWQDMTGVGGRTSGAVMTNTTGRTILVQIVNTSAFSSTITPTVGGVSLGQSSIGDVSAGSLTWREFLVPPGQTYSVTTTPSIGRWMELRS